MKPPPPLTKVEIIERSLSCFELGLLGLLPVIGLPMAVQAMFYYRRVRNDQSGLWNPAHRYLRWGAICAQLGVVVFFASLGIIAMLIEHLITKD